MSIDRITPESYATDQHHRAIADRILADLGESKMDCTLMVRQLDGTWLVQFVDRSTLPASVTIRERRWEPL